MMHSVQNTYSVPYEHACQSCALNNANRTFKRELVALTGSGRGAAILFIGYVIGQIPSNLICERVRALYSMGLVNVTGL